MVLEREPRNGRGYMLGVSNPTMDGEKIRESLQEVVFRLSLEEDQEMARWEELSRKKGQQKYSQVVSISEVFPTVF